MRATHLLPLVLLLAAADAPGSGFQIQEQNGRGVGSAFAGEGALAQDASTVWFNPAGMALLPGTQVVSSVDALSIEAHFHNDGSTENPAVGGAPLRGANSDGGEYAAIPDFYATQQLGDRVHLGLGISSPFGLRTEWDKGWIGRYHAIKSQLTTFNINPAISLRLFDWLSIGAGPNAMYSRATLTNDVDLGGACSIFGAAVGLNPVACRALGFVPQGIDGKVKVKGDDWALGYDAGILFMPSSSTRFGLHYRSRQDHELQGRVHFTIPEQAKLLQSTGALVKSVGRANLNLPDTVSLSAFHQVNPRWAVFADVTWTHWDRFDRLVINFNNPHQPTAVQPENWDNSYRIALGASWEPCARWTFRAGTAYDETPVPSPKFRTPRIPDSDRVWGALGVGYRWSDRLRFDFGYAHVFAIDVSSRNADQNTGHILRGDYSGGAEVVGAQLTLRVF